MAIAAEILAAAAGTDDRVCVIDLDTRQINIPKTIVALGVESDDDVHRLRFRMPKTYTGTDLSDLKIRINYMNANNEPDIYPVDDKTVSNDHIEFSWLVGDHALAYKGNVNFIVCMKEVGDGDTVLREFNTTVATLPVLEGLEVDAVPIEGELSDLLTSLQTQIDNAVSSATDKVDKKSQEEIGKIAAKGKDVLESIPDNWETTYKLYRTRANAIVSTAEGSVISVSDASDDYLRGLRVFGKSTQVTTTGTNLFSTNLEYGLWIFSSKTKNADNKYVKSANLVKVTPGKTYCFSGTAITNFQGNLAFYDVNGTYTGDDKQVYGFNTFTVPSDAHYIAFHTQVSFVKNINGTVQLEEGSISSAYEPYSGGVASPSPEWAQPIQSIENPTLDVTGANLFNFNGITDTSNIKRNVDGSLTVTIYSAPTGYTLKELAPTLKAGKRYTIYVDTDSSNKFIYFLDNKTTWSSGHTVDMTDSFLNDNVYIYGVNGDAPIIIRNIAIVPEGVVYNGEPYITPQTHIIPITLPGIPVTTGGNYTDENGQQWLCDEIDFERGVYVQRIGEMVCKGEESEYWSHNENIGVQKTGFFTLTLSKLNTTRESTDRAIMCDSYKASAKLPISNHEYWPKDTYFGIKQVAFRNDDYVDIVAWKQYLANNPITLIYELTTPIYHDLTEAELAAYSALHSNYPTTTVMNDQGAHMELKYNADTQKHLENTASKWVKVTVTPTEISEDGILTYFVADKTFGEIESLVQNGFIPYAYCEDLAGILGHVIAPYALTDSNNDSIIFLGSNGMHLEYFRNGTIEGRLYSYLTHHNMYCSDNLPDNPDSLATYNDGPLSAGATLAVIDKKLAENSGTNLDIFKVTVNADEMTIYPSEEEVVAAINAGKFIEVHRYGDVGFESVSYGWSRESDQETDHEYMYNLGGYTFAFDQ